MLINGKDPTRAAAFGALVLVLAAAFLWVLWALRIVVLIAFGACCLASAFSPIVSRLERLRVPRIAAIALVYITVFALIPWILFMIMAPPIQEEARRVSEVLPGLITQVQDKMAAFSDDAKRYGINISLNEASRGGYGHQRIPASPAAQLICHRHGVGDNLHHLHLLARGPATEQAVLPLAAPRGVSASRRAGPRGDEQPDGRLLSRNSRRRLDR